jgi:hypothetical protein
LKVSQVAQNESVEGDYPITATKSNNVGSDQVVNSITKRNFDRNERNDSAVNGIKVLTSTEVNDIIDKERINNHDINNAQSKPKTSSEVDLNSNPTGAWGSKRSFIDVSILVFFFLIFTSRKIIH